MRTLLAASLSGLLFGAGLVISGMADPARVLGFLTLAPGWDPSLAFVMGGALLVTVPGFAWLVSSSAPRFGGEYVKPANAAIDRRLLAGAAIFGAGWGLAGYCPGPALVAAGQLSPMALLFVAAMLGGAWIADRQQKA